METSPLVSLPKIRSLEVAIRNPISLASARRFVLVCTLAAAGSAHALGQRKIVFWGIDQLNSGNAIQDELDLVQCEPGGGFTLALRANGTVKLWGSNWNGLISDTPPGSSFTRIAVGVGHCLALRANGSIAAWGYDADGQVQRTPSGGGFVDIAGGLHNSYALRTDGSIVAWGQDLYGQVSNAPSGPGFVAVAGGTYHAVALHQDGSIAAWGSSLHSNVTQAPAGNDFVQIQAYDHLAMALRSNGSIVAWGIDVDPRVQDVPTEFGFAEIALGFAGVALRQDGTVMTWGYATPGEFLIPPPFAGGFSDISCGSSRVNAFRSVAFAELGRVARWTGPFYGDTAYAPSGRQAVELSAGFMHSMLRNKDGSIESWGADGYGEVSETPSGTGFKQVCAGWGVSAALRADGSIATWGLDYTGLDVPVPVGTGFTQVDLGGSVGSALRSDGSIASWGADWLYMHVSQTPAGPGYRKIALGYRHSLALRADGSIVRWGYPTGFVPPGTGFVDIAAGDEADFAIRSDGSLLSWGDNTYGHISMTPTGNDFVAVEAFDYLTAAVRKDGSVVTWPPAYNITTSAGGGTALAVGKHEVVTLEPDSPGTAYCFGTGAHSDCPCGTSSQEGEGCLNSTGTGGARLTASGHASVAHGSFQLHVEQVPNTTIGLLLRGLNYDSHGFGHPFGDGLLCIGSIQARSQLQVTVAGETTFTHFNGLPLGTFSLNSGGYTHYQYWYRDGSNSCTGTGFNLSNAWMVEWSL